MPGKRRSGLANDRRAYYFSEFKYIYNVCDSLPNNTPYQLCSPWPQFGGSDNTNSRYIPLLASQTGNISLLNSSNHFYVINTSLTIAKDGTIYAGLNQVDPSNFFNNLQGFLIAFNENGSIQWQYSLDSSDTFIQSTPTIGSDGTIYFGSALGYVYAINSNGTLKWKQQYTIPYSSFSPVGHISASLIIGNDNNLYFGVNAGYTSGGTTTRFSNIYSITTSNGSINWTYSLTNANISDSVAIDKNNNIYVVYHQPNNSQLLYVLSLDSNGNVRFQTDINQTIVGYGVGNLPCSRPTLSIDNSIVYVLSNVYIQTGGSGTFVYLHSLRTSDGNYTRSAIQFPTNNIYNNSIARDRNDTLYFTISDLSNNCVLYSYSTGSGAQIFYKTNAPNVVGGLAFCDNTPAIGSDGTIYYSVSLTDNNTYSNSYMYAVQSDGTLKWNTTISNASDISYSYTNTSCAVNLKGNVIISDFVFNYSETLCYSNLYSFS
jgi:hypothetical protein